MENAGDGTGSTSYVLPKATDSNGPTGSGQRFVWRYRDYVVDAFNRDLPYDQFVQRAVGRGLAPSRRSTRVTDRDRLPGSRSQERRRDDQPVELERMIETFASGRAATNMSSALGDGLSSV